MKHSAVCEDDMSHRFFTNTKCEYFPCHTGIDPAEFNCLFCYCPLYALGKNCGGNFVYLKNGIKDCRNCTLPHKKENYDTIINRFSDIAKLSEDKE